MAAVQRVDASTAPTDPVSAVLGGTAAWYRNRFVLRNCRVAGGRAVHAVRLVAWIGGVQVPAPACHIGIGGWDLSALQPSTQPVTCRRCLRLRADGDTADGPAVTPLQLRLC